MVLVVGLFRSSVSLWYFVSFKEFSLLFKLSKMLFIVPEYPLNVCSVCSDTISPIPVIGNRVFLSFFVHLHRDLHLNQMRKIKSDKNQFYWSFQRVGFLFHWCFFCFFVVVVSFVSFFLLPLLFHIYLLVFDVMCQVLNPGLLHCRQIPHSLSHQGSPRWKLLY